MAAGPGGDVDDAAVLLLAHRRQHRAHAILDAVEIDLDQFIPAFQLHVRPAPFRNIDAATVDQEIEAAMPGENLIRDFGHTTGLPDNARNHLDLSAPLGNL